MIGAVTRFFGRFYEAAEQAVTGNRWQTLSDPARDEDSVLTEYDRALISGSIADLLRNDPTLSGAASRVTEFCVGENGIQPQAMTSDPAWNKLADDWYRDRQSWIDQRGLVSGRELQKLSLYARMQSGDMLFVKTDTLQLQPVEGSRIRTPSKLASDKAVQKGIRKQGGKIVGFYVSERNDYGVLDNDKYEFIDARDAIYIRAPSWRIDITRPAPEFAPLVRLARDMKDLSQSILKKARMDATMGWAIKTKQGQKAATRRGLAGRDTTDHNAENPVRHESFNGLKAYYLNTDEDVSALSGTTPGAFYVEYDRSLLRKLGGCIGFPMEFVVLDFSNGSYANSRAAVLTAYQAVVIRQNWIKEQLLEPDRNWAIAQAIELGILPPAPVDSRGVSEWRLCRWTLPRHAWIDPKGQGEANRNDWLLGTRSPFEIVAQETGRDALEVIVDKAEYLQGVKRIAKEYDIDDWRDLVDTSTNGQRTIEQEGMQE